MPSKRMVSTGAQPPKRDPAESRHPSPARPGCEARNFWEGSAGRASGALPGLLLRRLHRILDVRNGLELHIIELAIHLLDLAHIDILDDVARLGIDGDRAARA